MTCSHTFRGSSSSSSGFSIARSGKLGWHFPTIEEDITTPHRLAVRFQEATIGAQAQAALLRIGARPLSTPNEQGAATYEITDADARIASMQLRGVPGIAGAGPVVLRQKTSIPDDPFFTTIDQWDMYAIGMPSAWDITTGSTSVRIAILDTGYDKGNQDLVGQVDAFAVYDKGTGQPSSDTIEDVDGHGTDTSGIAAAHTNNAYGVAGTGWKVHLLEARVFSESAALCAPSKPPCAASNDIAAAINWAVSKGANVISMSLGSSMPDPTFEEPAVASAIMHGVTVIAAAGNSGLNTLDYPAADPNVISVGASAYCDSVANTHSPGDYEYVAGYSNYGAGLTLVAPGGDPDAAQAPPTPCKQNCPPVDNLQWIENLDSFQGQFMEPVSLFAGTSQAAPHVAGAVALMISKDPALSPAQALQILKSTADNINDSHQGAGRLNVLKALNATP